ncbi:MAG TPA: LysR substrate-binding domain-containing protein, partial [Polyangiaceae bacterium]|nr:LysR substrate-binding domain-containing protein [Polyangiaceae bacterium]
PRPGTNTLRLSGENGEETVDVDWIIGSDEMGSLYVAAAAGAGIALVPWPLPHSSDLAAKLVRVLPAYAMSGGAVYAVSPASRHQLARVKLLRDFLVEALVRELSAVWPT